MTITNLIMRTRKNDPCFPHLDSDAYYESKETFDGGGLTKREFFAAAALQGLLANSSITDCEMYPPINIPERAVVLADALIVELNKQPGRQPYEKPE